MNELMTIWLKVPPELKLLGASLVGAGFYATSAESVGFVRALRSLGFALFGGFFGLLVLFKVAGFAGWSAVTAENLWMVGAFGGYYGDRFWKAAGTVNLNNIVQTYLKQMNNNGKE